MRKEQNLNRQCQPSMQRHHDNQQNLADLAIRRAENGVQVPQQERDAHAEPDGDERPVQDLEGRPADEGDGDPNEVGVAVEGPAFKEVGEFAAEVAEGEEEDDGDDEGVAVDEASSACFLSMSHSYRENWRAYH